MYRSSISPTPCRLCAQINGLRNDFNKVAVYLVAAFVTESEKVVAPTPVKVSRRHNNVVMLKFNGWFCFQRALLLGVYQLLDVCDQFAPAQLNASLSMAGRQIFQNILHEFKTFHKFSGSA